MIMSYHSNFPLDLTKPVPEKAVNILVDMYKHNRFNFCFGLFSTMDKAYYLFSRVYEKWVCEGRPSDFEGWFSGIPVDGLEGEQKQHMGALLAKASIVLSVWADSLPKPKPFKIPDRITLPNIKGHMPDIRQVLSDNSVKDAE